MCRRITPLLLFLAGIVGSASAQPSAAVSDLMAQFDAEHDLAAKERLLRSLTTDYEDMGPALLRLAESTTNSDTRWMAMRGMAQLHYEESAPFLEASLKDSDVLIRANAARALGDLRISSAAEPLVAMFAVEKEPGAIEQASLALRMLDVRAAAPYVREKIALYPGQTRGWLIQALGTLGSVSEDVPRIAQYLDEATGSTTVEAIEELTGLSFGPGKRTGPVGLPTPETMAARNWWQSRKDAWPRCPECRPK